MLGELILSGVLPQLAYSIPLFLVWLVGFILAIITWKKHAKASLLTMIAMVIFTINQVISTLLSFLPVYLHNMSGMKISTIGTITLIANIVLIVFATVAWILLILALFLRRKPRTQPEIVSLPPQ